MFLDPPLLTCFLLVFTCCFLYHGLIYWFSSAIYGFDAFYHFRLAEQVLDGSIFSGIKSLPLTALGEKGPDHHLFFHILISPFTLLNSFSGLKIAASATAALCSALLYLLARRLEIRPASLLVLLLFASGNIYALRIGMLKAQSITVPITLFALYYLSQSRHNQCGFLGILYSWSYHGSVICIPLALLSVLSSYLTEKKWDLRAPSYLCLGMILGHIINPYLPNNFEFLFFHLFFKMQNSVGTPVGLEWSTVTGWFLFQELWPLFLFFCVTATSYLLAPVRVKRDTMLFASATAMYLVMTLKHFRFIEYFIPCSAFLLFLVLRNSGALEQLRRNKRQCFAVLTLLISLSILNYYRSLPVMNVGNSDERLKIISEYLRRHTTPGEIVLNLHWDDYPFLYYHNPSNRYVTGLDPLLLQYASPEKFVLINHVNAGRIKPDNLTAALKQEFGARFIVAHADDHIFNHAQGLKMALKTRYGVLWEIL